MEVATIEPFLKKPCLDFTRLPPGCFFELLSGRAVQGVRSYCSQPVRRAAQWTALHLAPRRDSGGLFAEVLEAGRTF